MYIKNLPQKATLNDRGVLKPDNDTIAIEDGVLSVVQPIQVVAQGTGSDEEIVAMVKAADAGRLNLTECQAVGDERTVSLAAITTYPSELDDTHAAQDIILVLAASDTGTTDSTNPCYNYQYATATSGRTYPSFIFQMKNCLNEKGRISTSTTYPSDFGYNMSPRRTQCNNYFKPAFPNSLISIVKNIVLKSQDYLGTIQTTNDYFFLATEKEILNNRYGSQPDEFNALAFQTYYNITSNRIKQVNGSNSSYQLRSPRYMGSFANGFLAIDTTGTYIDSSSPTYNYGLAICGCI